MPATERKEAEIFVDCNLVHAKKQAWFILNCNEMIERYGEQLGRWIIDGLDTVTVNAE